MNSNPEPASGELRFTGFSDDILDVSGAISEEFGNTSGEITVMVAGPEYGALLIHARLSNYACWQLGVAQVDEDAKLPPWPVRIEQASDTEYSPVLILGAPAGSTISEVERAF